MFRIYIFIVTLGLSLNALAAAPILNGGDLATTCRAFSAKPEGYHRTPEGANDPCRKFIEGFFQTLKDRNDAELMAKTQNINGPVRPCVRMPDNLTYRQFAARIVALDDVNPSLRTASPAGLAQRALEVNYPCPEQTMPPSK